MARELVFGVHPVMEVLRSGRRRAHELHCGRSPKDAGIREILSLARAAGVTINQVDKGAIRYQDQPTIVSWTHEPGTYVHISMVGWS